MLFLDLRFIEFLFSRGLVRLFGEIVFFKVEGLMPYTSRVPRCVWRDYLKYRRKRWSDLDTIFSQIPVVGPGFPGVRKWLQ